MMIHVQYSSGEYDYVRPEILDRKLTTGEIKKFSRSTGWAVVGRDRIRDNSVNRGYYLGQERRYQMN